MVRKRYIGRMYVKMPVYVQQWLRTKYQAPEDACSPIALPWLASEAGRIVYSRLIPNERMKKLAPTCYSDEMFSKCLDDIPPEFLSRFPSVDSRDNFCCIALPSPHFFSGKFISDECFWQLSAPDTKEFTSILEDEFWGDVGMFWQDWKKNFLIHHPGMHPALWDALLDFLDFYRVKPDVMDTLYRQLSRRKKDFPSLN